MTLLFFKNRVGAAEQAVDSAKIGAVYVGNGVFRRAKAPVLLRHAGVFIRASLPKPHISCKAMITTLEALRHTVSMILRQAGLW